MQITLSKYNCPWNSINKTLTNLTDILLTPKHKLDLTEPTFIVHIEDLNNSLENFDYNYCVFNDVSRCYFIYNKELLSQNRVRVFCELDYFETYKTQILQSTFTYSRHYTNSLGVPEYEPQQNVQPESVFGSVKDLKTTGNVKVSELYSDISLQKGNTNILSVLGVR